VARLCVCLDESGFDDMAGLLAGEATVRTVRGEVVGSDAVVEQARRTHPADQRFQHVITNLLVDLDGDRATARANLEVHITVPGDGPAGDGSPAPAPPRPRFCLRPCDRRHSGRWAGPRILWTHMARSAQVSVLGPVRLLLDGRDCTPGGALQRRLLCALALQGAGSGPGGDLAGLMWPEGLPGDPRAALQTHVFRLRRLLPEGAISTTAGGSYRLDLGPGALDAARFEAGLYGARALRAPDPPAAGGA